MTFPGQSQLDDRSADWSWPFWPAVPLYPYGQRQTLQVEIVPEWIWTFEQIQGLLSVVTPIRMTVVRLESGGFLIYAPVAPTPECVRMLNGLVALYGEVKYIILPTVSGVEHKVFAGPFARCYPRAQVFVAPHQWSFPLDLPLTWLGLPWGRTQRLPQDPKQAPFYADFDYAILGPIGLGVGPFEEVAFFHRSTGTLLVTDTVLSVSVEPPAVVQLDPYPLLYHAKDGVTDPIVDAPSQRRKGWQRIALFSFYFRPAAVEIAGMKESIREAKLAPDRSVRNYFGWFPYRWRSDWEVSFERLSQGERVRVAPILQELILNRAPQETLAWADRVATWDFQRIVPCHFAAPIAAGPVAFRSAFAFLEVGKLEMAGEIEAGESEDLQVLRQIEAGLLRVRAMPAAQR
jgi:hypothetical protein